MVEPTIAKQAYKNTLLLSSVVVLVFSAWANVSWVIRNPMYLKFVPPFQPGVDFNFNYAIGGGYFSIASAIVDGRGFADPFQCGSGPTAWMPPMLCWILAFFLWAFDGSLPLVIIAMVTIQNIALICTAWLMLRVLSSMAAYWVGFIFLFQIWFQFHPAFQTTGDGGYLMLIMNGVLAGYCLFNPYYNLIRSTAWGVFGGLACLSNPILGFVWVGLGFVASEKQRTLFFASLVAFAIVVSPWIVRNYLTFERFIPVKSNLAFELYQSQNLQTEGVLRAEVLLEHPATVGSAAREEYLELGEAVFLDRAMDRFIQEFSNRPLGYFRKVWERFLAVAVIYRPNQYNKMYGVMALSLGFLVYPLPFVAWIIMIKEWLQGRLNKCGIIIMFSYILYFTPYVLISYYDRYAFPANSIKWMLIAWGGYALSEKVTWMLRRVRMDGVLRSFYRAGVHGHDDP